jgi:hypothetical protein
MDMGVIALLFQCPHIQCLLHPQPPRALPDADSIFNVSLPKQKAHHKG